jgi:hypothetical protein
MCSLVSVAVSDYASDPREVFRAHGFHTAPAANPHMRASLPQDAMVLDVTRSGCSCEFYLSPAIAAAEMDGERERRRYRRKGWPAAKIARVMAEKSAAATAPHRLLHGGCANFCQAVERIVRFGAGMQLLAHEFTGRFAEEPVTVLGAVEIGLAEFLAGGGAFPEDTVVKIVRGG